MDNLVKVKKIEIHEYSFNIIVNFNKLEPVLKQELKSYRISDAQLILNIDCHKTSYTGFLQGGLGIVIPPSLTDEKDNWEGTRDKLEWDCWAMSSFTIVPSNVTSNVEPQFILAVCDSNFFGLNYQELIRVPMDVVTEGPYSAFPQDGDDEEEMNSAIKHLLEFFRQRYDAQLVDLESLDKLAIATFYDTLNNR